MRISTIFAAAVATFAYTFTSAGDPEEIVEFDGNLVELEDSNPNEFSTLMTLLRSVGLDEALMGQGPFTVFAPTNDAFVALFLQEHVLDYLGSNPDELKKVLLYHVIGDFFIGG